jgi:hypothetical protein
MAFYFPFVASKNKDPQKEWLKPFLGSSHFGSQLFLTSHFGSLNGL